MSVTSVQADRGVPASGPETADAGSRLLALADQCVQCGLCLPHCPTYRLDRSESESPRGRIAWTRAVASGRLAPTPAAERHLDLCLGCRRCEPVCPAGVQYGDLLLLARADQARRRPPSPRRRRLLALLARPRLLDALLGLYRVVFPLLPAAWRPLPRPPEAGSGLGGSPSGSIEPTALFLGCVARRYEGPSRLALQRLLQAAGSEARVPDGQGCCGAAAAHAGLADAAASLAAVNRAAFAGQGTVLCLSSGCHASLADAVAGTVEDPLAWLDRQGDRLGFRPAARRIALHLPCTQRSVVGSEAPLRRLLARVPGLDLVVLPDTGCCGAAGLHQLEEPARAAALRAPLLAALQASGAVELLSANIGCRLHLADGTTLPVRHPLDFLADHLA